MPALTVRQAFELALGHHQAGRLGEAEALYRQILAVHPQHAEAWHMLGAVALQSGRHDLAPIWIGQAIALTPNNPAAHSNLGEAYRVSGRLDEAVASFRRALDLKGDYPMAQYNLGVALADLGRFDEAITAYDRALILKPDYFEAHLHRGNALRNRGRLDEAAGAYRRALELKPDFAQAHNNLGVALSEMGQAGGAVAAIRRALELQPDSAEFHNNLGNALIVGGQFDEAVAAFGRALEIKPDYAEAHSNLGNALRERGQFPEAIAAYRRALEIAPNTAGIHNNLGNALRDLGQLGEAITAYRRALELNSGLVEAQSNLGAVLTEQGALDEAVVALRRALELNPNYADTHNNLGSVLKDQGHLDEAIAAYRRALELNPAGAKAQSNIILTLLCHPAQEPRVMIEAQRRWNDQFCKPLARFIEPFSNDRSPERPLRIGYVSPAFCAHVVGRNLLPLFRGHDHHYFEIVCYADVAKADELTEEFRRRADQWRGTVGLTDEALAGMIRQDRVDILVDLSLHTRGNRLPVFARCPAPVRVSFAGYPDSVGIDAIEYRISDGYLEAGASEIGVRGSEFGIEPPDALRSPIPHPGPALSLSKGPAERVYLIDSFWCYDPCGADVAVNGLPAEDNASVTFGSLNNFCKINEGILKLWARVLLQTAGSRLLLLAHRGSHRQRTVDFLEREGIEPGRVEFSEWCARRDYLELYHRLDIVLDPFPYGGHTTSLDALWMGVPVVSLAGPAPVSRAGLSILSNLALPELVAFSEDDYVRIAVGLARDRKRLAELRRTLRPRMEGSVLMDAPRFARNIESAYRAMWRRWCLEDQS